MIHKKNRETRRYVEFLLGKGFILSCKKVGRYYTTFVYRNNRTHRYRFAGYSICNSLAVAANYFHVIEEVQENR